MMKLVPRLLLIIKKKKAPRGTPVVWKRINLDQSNDVLLCSFDGAQESSKQILRLRGCRFPYDLARIKGKNFNVLTIGEGVWFEMIRHA